MNGTIIEKIKGEIEAYQACTSVRAIAALNVRDQQICISLNSSFTLWMNCNQPLWNLNFYFASFLWKREGCWASY